MLYQQGNKLIREFDGEILQIEPYYENSFRVRVTKLGEFSNEDWALLPQKELNPQITINAKKYEEDGIKANAEDKVIGETAEIINGKIKLIITADGKMSFQNLKGDKLLEEFEIDRHSILGINSRELRTVTSSNFKASLKFKSNKKEKIYGMGQYQNGIFNLKGSVLELAQRNSQASVPFLYSSLGYGFLWNNPGIGKVTFGTNITEWEAYCTKEIDFWITAGDTPEEIEQNYANVTGKTPMMPDFAMGFWQCKLRYKNQEELLNVAREYKKRGIPLDVIVIDFFHWPYEGNWEFDKEYWPDPAAMVKELDSMGVKLMVSVWPTVSIHSSNYKEMREKGYLIRSENGVKINMLMLDCTSFTDSTNPKAREFMWSKIKENYYDYGIKTFWLDVAEPEYSSYDFDNYRYHKGTATEIGNQYPVLYTKTFYDGLKSQNEDEIISLVRCAWAGSQQYGALVWSGDIPSTFDSFKNQVICGLQMAMAGIPWWTTDIGGFLDGNIHDDSFRELLIRWFQYGAFCPVMRLHGSREPSTSGNGIHGGGLCGSGAENEVWSFGDEAYEICKKYISLREDLKPYIKNLMKNAHETGSLVMRPMFYEFHDDENTWELEDQFMFGEELLIAPVLELGARERKVYLPQGYKWQNYFTDEIFEGGQEIICPAPIDIIPVFKKI